MKNSEFSINESKGFSLTFDNGWTVSVQWGRGNYCDNREIQRANMDAIERGELKCESSTAECAVWNNYGVWQSFDRETFDELLPVKGAGFVEGYLNTNDVAKLIALVSSQKATYKLHEVL